MYHALTEDIKWETLQKLRTMKIDILSQRIVCHHAQCSMLNICKWKNNFFLFKIKQALSENVTKSKVVSKVWHTIP